ncbi:magnesium transporter [Fulvivirgaceae bacterium BMA12]|uniref:Magnesium transporter MgtE n=1 Tax=Agaribacillus aureus TaxID=3051825 RepID=A0ABT8LCU5_9BACT|nr:magnesium transporter [Fulvivirgaceae bacterium BMA12]
MTVSTQFELSKEYLERLKLAIEEKNVDFIRETMEGVNPADISAVLEEFDGVDSKYVVDNLDTAIGAQIISDLEEDTRKDFLKVFEPGEIAQFIEIIDSDDGADILNEIPVKIREKIIASLDNEEKVSHLLDLLRYEEDTAGGLMAKELIKANINWTVIQCIEEIRRQAENVEKIYSMYVVDDRDKLLGRVSLKKIILSDDKTKIADIYSEDVISVQTFMEEAEVAATMQKYDLVAVPVVNLQGKLVGRITIDDVVDVITEIAEQERQIMSGISEDVEEDDNLWVLTRARLPWLIFGLFGGLLGAKVIGFFEGDIKKITEIALFIPLIMATGGNVGIQSSSIIVQSLASRSVFEENTVKRLLKVLLVALINGIVLGIIVLGISYWIMDWQNVDFAVVVSVALFCVVLLASFMGTVTPLLLNRFNINPALASGPFITTANDILGLGVYLVVVRLFYAI